jgi:hypothetical protein
MRFVLAPRSNKMTGPSRTARIHVPISLRQRCKSLVKVPMHEINCYLKTSRDISGYLATPLRCFQELAKSREQCKQIAQPVLSEARNAGSGIMGLCFDGRIRAVSPCPLLRDTRVEPVGVVVED